MQPVIVMPMHDPDGILFPHLQAVTPTLKTVFAQAFVSVTAVTQRKYPQYTSWLASDSFFHVITYQQETSIGDEFLALYAQAAAYCQPNQVLHLCFIDRVSFALETNHRKRFLTDIQLTQPQHTPLIFQRSPTAWETHPQNYRQVEHMLTTAGSWLFNQSLDFAFCHRALTTQQLKQTLPQITRRDLSLVAEFVLILRADIQSKDVDWLAWEDPFIYARDAQELKREREQSVEETQKRLAYAIPILQLLTNAAKGGT